MKKLFYLVLLLFFTQLNYSQNLNQSVRDFVEGKYFNNQETGRSIKFGYISSLNTYGLTFKDSEGNLAYFMNCSINFSSNNQYMALTYCMSPVTGDTLGKIGVYKDRMIWYGTDGSLTFYIENDGTQSESNNTEQKHEYSSLIEGAKNRLPKDGIIISLSEAKRVIGKPKKIGNIEIAQFDFSKAMNFENASKSCEQLGDGWRLPTKDELNIIYKNKTLIGGFIKVSYNLEYWSSTKSLESKDNYWIKWFSNGWGGYDNKGITIQVRAVRSL